ncbi:hypothetical protein [Paraburkholderia domus]|uniref:hypothetical protein n=1 Tax=Paraburkholderia domus TaxID=2793075 RepID=UPI001B8B121A|nr:hypothetical protein [Paraburkholderia domus]
MPTSAALASSSAVGIANLVAPVATANAAPPQGFMHWAMANPVVIAAMIAGGVAFTVGFLTFFGVVLSLRNSRKESIRDRKHAADEAHRERLATMRREVYLNAVAELVKAQIYVGSLAKQDITKTNIISGLEGFQVAVAKVAVVAEQQTALKARELSSRYASLLLDSMRFLVPMALAKNASADFQRHYDASRAAVDAVLAEMDQLNKTGTPSPIAFSALKRSFDMHSSLAATHSANRDNANKMANAAEIDFAKSLPAKMKAISIELDDLACAIRLELNIETDRAAFGKQTEEIFAKMEAAGKDTLKLAENMNGQLSAASATTGA